jgi:Rrf2 family transcriptional regulator, nitric oxide-sensitive transcriptional repressor
MIRPRRSENHLTQAALFQTIRSSCPIKESSDLKLDVKVSFWEKCGIAMISQTVEYALRAVVYLASQSPEARTTEQIATATKVPKPYLSKVLQGLVRNGVVHSQRGIGGGMTLVKAPRDLTILEVVNSVEPIERIRECPLGLESHGVHLCPLHRRLDDAMASVERAFDSTTLAEVLDEPTTSIPLCDFPPISTRAERD